MSEGEEVYQKRDIILARLDENVKSGIAMLTELKGEFKNHTNQDKLDFSAVGLEMKNIKDDIESKHNLVLRIILPASGGCAVVVILMQLFFSR